MQVRKTMRQVLGNEHKETLYSAVNFAHTFGLEDRCIEAPNSVRDVIPYFLHYQIQSFNADRHPFQTNNVVNAYRICSVYLLTARAMQWRIFSKKMLLVIHICVSRYLMRKCPPCRRVHLGFAIHSLVLVPSSLLLLLGPSAKSSFPPKGPEPSESEPIETVAPFIALAAIRLTSTCTTPLLQTSESISHFLTTDSPLVMMNNEVQDFHIYSNCVKKISSSTRVWRLLHCGIDSYSYRV